MFMKERLDEFYEMLKIDRKKSPWSRENSFESRFEELRKEIEEVGVALKNDDMKNFEEEIGDCLWDLLFLIVIAEEKGLFTGRDVVEGSIAKLKRRKPWIFEGEAVKSVEEEIELWNRAKRELEGRGGI